MNRLPINGSKPATNSPAIHCISMIYYLGFVAICLPLFMLNSLIDLFFPKICYACEKTIESNIKHICLSCRHHLPRLHTQLYPQNPIDRIFWGRVHFEKATSLLKFEENGKIQKLMHQLKYRGIKEIGITLGELAAQEIQESNFFEGIDLILPIPMHRRKVNKRGYNQCHFIGEGIKNITQITMDTTSVIKSTNTESQTKKGRYERWLNANMTFQVLDPGPLEGKHILLVDDIVTTGATVEALAIELNKISEVKLSLLTIACTF